MDNETDKPKESPSIVYAIPQTMPQDDSDEIDLRELWHTLMRRKLIVIATTALILLASLAYVFLLPPVYEAKVLLKIGVHNTTQLLESTNALQAYINFKYDLSRDYTRDITEFYLTAVSVPDKNAGYISITANGPTGADAKNVLSAAVDDIQARHQVLFTSIVASDLIKIESTEKQIDYYSDDVLPQIKRELESLQTLQANRIKRNIESSEFNLELDYLLDEIISGKVSGLKELVDITIPKLETEAEKLKKNLKPPFLEMTSIVGDIAVPEGPVKPNKKMILAVALVAGVMLGIFLVFFLEFIKPKKAAAEEE